MLTNQILKIIYKNKKVEFGTKTNFCNQIGIQNGTLNRYLDNKVELKLSELQRISEKLNIKISVSWKQQ